MNRFGYGYILYINYQYSFKYILFNNLQIIYNITIFIIIFYYYNRLTELPELLSPISFSLSFIPKLPFTIGAENGSKLPPL